MEAEAPGLPVLLVAINPGNMPARELAMLVLGMEASCLLSIVATAPVRLARFCVPYPTTTTSSNCSISSCMTTFMVPFAVAGISCSL